jgi:hypothetical protein
MWSSMSVDLGMERAALVGVDWVKMAHRMLVGMDVVESAYRI